MLHVPTGLAELHGQPVQQFRMRRGFALRAEVFGRRHQALPKHFLPEAIDGDTARERMRVVHQPFRQAKPVPREGGRHGRQNAGGGRTNLFAGLIVHPAIENMRYRFGVLFFLHHVCDGTAAENRATLVFQRLQIVHRAPIVPVVADEVAMLEGFPFGGSERTAPLASGSGKRIPRGQQSGLRFGHCAIQDAKVSDRTLQETRLLAVLSVLGTQ